jgi:hypothetical protein
MLLVNRFGKEQQDFIDMRASFSSKALMEYSSPSSNHSSSIAAILFSSADALCLC